MKMNIKASYKYQFAVWRKSMLVYYLTMTGILALLFAIINITVSGSGEHPMRITGGEFSTMIFMFVMGIASFKENFLMLSQNGISRRSNFLGAVTVALTFAAVAALIDVLLNLLSYYIYTNTDELSYTMLSFFFLPYEGFLKYLGAFLYCFSMYSLCVMLGGFIGSLYYRLSTTGKIIVSITVPGVFCVAIPVLDNFYLNGAAAALLAKFVDLAFGISRGLPLMGVLTFFIFATVFALCYWLVMRKTVIKTL